MRMLMSAEGYVETDYFRDVHAVFTDMDGTLTTGAKLLPSTYRALADLTTAGIPVVIVTGRPSGWGEAIARLWPVAGVIAENGGVTYLPGRGGRLKKRFAVPGATLPALRRRMQRTAAAAMRAFPGCRLSSDAPATEVNLALDWNEDARIPEATARKLELWLRARGWAAVRSSVHINFWPPGFDKLTACKQVVKSLFPRVPGGLAPYIYVGDALNDEPMFRGFPRSVGVANVREVWDELQHRPAHVTTAAYGPGFEELAGLILSARGRPKRA